MTGETIILTPHVQQQLTVLTALEHGQLTVLEAARLLKRSDRQVRRLRHAYRIRGPAALVHGNRARRSPRRLGDALRERIVALARTTYAGTNRTHLRELLEEREGIRIGRTSLQRILDEAGVRSPRRRRSRRHRRRRERMPREGMLLQVDGSDHDWLQGRGPRLVLLAAVDDATGRVPSATFRDQEDAHGYLFLFRETARTAGLALSVYSDRHSIFEHTARRPLTLHEQLQGGPAPTQVGRALQEGGIRWIPASSPQAKGRIETLFGTLQDRLVTELRLAGINDREAANVFLPGFLARYNARFAQPAALPDPAYRPCSGLDLDTIFCFKYLRTVANDNTVTLGARCVQILPGAAHRSYAKARVEVHERLDGTITIYYRGERLPTEELTSAPTQRIAARYYDRPRPDSVINGARVGGSQTAGLPRKTPPAASDEAMSEKTLAPRARQPWKPSPDHPWRHMPIGSVRKRTSSRGRTNSLNR